MINTSGQPALVDGTRKECRGVIAMLEQLAAGGEHSTVQAVVSTLADRRDVEEWAARKGHRILGVDSSGSAHRLTIALKTPEAA